MARKLITAAEHLRRLKSETEESWYARCAVVRAFLGHRTANPGCRAKLFQLKGVDIGGRIRIPDFTVACDRGDRVWAIEIGLLGSERRDDLDAAFDGVHHVHRNRSVEWETHCHGCPEPSKGRSRAVAERTNPSRATPQEARALAKRLRAKRPPKPAGGRAALRSRSVGRRAGKKRRK